jgi:Mycothiol maleylpyruvate isomerase N-terminal domain
MRLPRRGWLGLRTDRVVKDAERVAEGMLADVVLDGFIRALDGFETVLAGVAPGCWSAPSPCAGWSAADVAGHVIGGLRATEAMARGRYAESEAGDPLLHP